MGELGEPDPGIHNDRRRVDAGRRDRIDPLPELVADLAHDVLVDRPLLHIAAGPARVHDRVRHASLRDQPGQPRVGPAAADVVDHPRPGLEGELRHAGPHRVHADRKPGAGELRDDRADPAQFLRLVDPLGPRAGRLAPDVYDVGSLGGEPEAMGHRGSGLEPRAAVGERVRGDVDDAHDQAAARVRQASGMCPPEHRRARLVSHGANLRRYAVARDRRAAAPSRRPTLPSPSLRAILRTSTVGQTRKASASRAARAILGTSLVPVKTMNRGTHSGQNFALNLYSDSIWNQRDMNSSVRRQARSTGPAPIRSPRSSAARNAAKFSETRLTPRAWAFLMVSTIRKSLRPGCALLSRRIRSRESPSLPQGTKCKIARSTPSSVAVAITQFSSPGAPTRPSAMEKPRSVGLPRQESACLIRRLISARGMSPIRRISAT